MQEQTKVIGCRLKSIREQLGISIAEVATATGINKYQYEDYESGEIDIAVSSLLKIADYFKIEPALILTGENPHKKEWAVTRRGEGVSVERHARYKYKALAADFAGKKATPFLVTVDANDQEVQFSTHKGQEFLYVLEGCLKVYFNNESVELCVGDSVYFDSEVSHAMKAENGGRARFVSVLV
ncbi:MAG: XRE family transcriptional regulator [Bacteroidales bacterium]|jgi:transcriptional regulator with XRE-family HTH domain|nr:XRE family transcriptional regulator [Bacteroidales bacterium]